MTSQEDQKHTNKPWLMNLRLQLMVLFKIITILNQIQKNVGKKYTINF